MLLNPVIRNSIGILKYIALHGDQQFSLEIHKERGVERIDARDRRAVFYFKISGFIDKSHIYSNGIIIITSLNIREI